MFRLCLWDYSGSVCKVAPWSMRIHLSVKAGIIAFLFHLYPSYFWSIVPSPADVYSSSRVNEQVLVSQLNLFIIHCQVRVNSVQPSRKWYLMFLVILCAEAKLTGSYFSMILSHVSHVKECRPYSFMRVKYSFTFLLPKSQFVATSNGSGSCLLSFSYSICRKNAKNLFPFRSTG